MNSNDGSNVGRLVVTGPAQNFGFVMLENMATGELTIPDGRRVEELSQEELVVLVRDLNRVIWENGRRAHKREQDIYRDVVRIGEMLRGMGTTIDSALERKGDSTTTDEPEIDKSSVDTARVKEG